MRANERAISRVRAGECEIHERSLRTTRAPVNRRPGISMNSARSRAITASTVLTTPFPFTAPMRVAPLRFQLYALRSQFHVRPIASTF
jgi:hypothetical protein